MVLGVQYVVLLMLSEVLSAGRGEVFRKQQKYSRVVSPACGCFMNMSSRAMLAASVLTSLL